MSDWGRSETARIVGECAGGVVEGRSLRGRSRMVAGDRYELRPWLIVDRKVEAPANAHNENDILPWLIGQNHRRVTQQVF